jgi:hypothetical protein
MMVLRSARGKDLGGSTPGCINWWNFVKLDLREDQRKYRLCGYFGVYIKTQREVVTGTNKKYN